LTCGRRRSERKLCEAGGTEQMWREVAEKALKVWMMMMDFAVVWRT
jgi:hypothetical protein